MHRGTEPTLTFTLPFECSKVTSLYITFAQKKTQYSEESEPVFEKVLSDCRKEGNKIMVTLTEADTLKLSHKFPVDIQMRGICDGKKFASNICQKDVFRIIKDGPLPDGVKA